LVEKVVEFKEQAVKQKTVQTMELAEKVMEFTEQMVKPMTVQTLELGEKVVENTNNQLFESEEVEYPQLDDMEYWLFGAAQLAADMKADEVLL